VKKVYEQARDNKELPEGVRLLIEKQMSVLKVSHHTIRELRSRAEAVQKR